MTDITKPNVISILREFSLRLIQGAIIGIGAILPGISGGVLCVAFGIYQPMMALLAHPVKTLPRYWKLFVPVLIGWIVGFICLARVIADLMEQNGPVVTCLFVGLIAGTFPSLFREGARFGRSKNAMQALLVSTAALLAFFFFLKFSAKTTLTPSFGWYLFCGALWGLSLIIPGMSSSSLLIFFGLYQPLSTGIGSLDFSIIVPFLIGIAASALPLARLVNQLFSRHYSVVFHCVIGFVIASTIPIIPYSFSSAAEAAFCVLAAVCGFVGSFFMDRWSAKNPVGADPGEPG